MHSFNTYLESIKKYDIDSIKSPLKNTCEINFKPEQTVFVIQKEYAITNANSDKHILGSAGAGPCIILALYDSKNKIAVLSHIDGSTVDSISLLIKDISIQHTVAHIAGGDSSSKKSALKFKMLEINKIKLQMLTL